MKIILLILTGIIIIKFNLFAEIPLKDTIYGGYTKREIIEYKYKEGKIDSTHKEKLFETIFNKNGKKNNELIYFDGNISLSDLYDENGNIIESRLYDFDKNLCQKIIFSFTLFGKVKSKTLYNNKNIVSYKDSLFYDNNNRLIKIITYDSNNVVVSFEKYEYFLDRISQSFKKYGSSDELKSIYKYDKNNILIAICDYCSANSICREKNYFYDDKSRIIERGNTFFGIYNKEADFKYDNKGNLLDSSHYNKGTISASFKYNYSPESILIKSEFFNASKNESISNIYDDKGRIIEQFKRKDDIIFTSKYNYDNFGNIIEIIEYKNKTTPISKIIYEYSK